MIIVSVSFAITLFFQLFREFFLIAVLKHLSKANTGTDAFLFLTSCDTLQHLSNFRHDSIETLLPNLCKLVMDAFNITFLEELTLVEHPLEADEM